jgi:hypothetical protein
MRWAPRETLGEFDFVEGDRKFLASFLSVRE